MRFIIILFFYVETKRLRFDCDCLIIGIAAFLSCYLKLLMRCYIMLILLTPWIVHMMLLEKMNQINFYFISFFFFIKVNFGLDEFEMSGAEKFWTPMWAYIWRLLKVLVIVLIGCAWWLWWLFDWHIGFNDMK